MKCPRCQHLIKKRSNNENSYYWGVVIDAIATETGNEPETIHQALKIKFLLNRMQCNGMLIATTKSTTELTTIEFEAYLDKVRLWASEFLHIEIPLPNEV